MEGGLHLRGEGMPGKPGTNEYSLVQARHPYLTDEAIELVRFLSQLPDVELWSLGHNRSDAVQFGLGVQVLVLAEASQQCVRASSVPWATSRTTTERGVHSEHATVLSEDTSTAWWGCYIFPSIVVPMTEVAMCSSTRTTASSPGTTQPMLATDLRVKPPAPAAPTGGGGGQHGSQ